MSGFLEAIGDHAAVIYGACGPIGVVAAGYLIWRVMTPDEEPALEAKTVGGAPAGGAKPNANPGQAQHQRMGSAKTAVLTPAGPIPSTPKPPPEDPTKKKVDRLSEIGFHHTVERNDTPSRAVPALAAQLAPTTVVTAPSSGSPSSAGIPAVPSAIHEPAPGSRPDLNDTPELDDILSRIDKVLSENPLMATSTIAGNQAPGTERLEPATETRPSGTAPVIAKPPDKGSDSGEQQRLF